MNNAQAIRAMKSPLAVEFSHTESALRDLMRDSHDVQGSDLLRLINTVIEDVASRIEVGESDKDVVEVRPYDVESLAISYKAFSNAIRENDSNGVEVWGKFLLDAQKATGVEIKKTSRIYELIDVFTAEWPDDHECFNWDD